MMTHKNTNANYSWLDFKPSVCKIANMLDDYVYKNAVKGFVSYLRTCTTQKKLAFFSDVSREYVRKLEKGERIPTIKVLISMIEAANIDINEGMNMFLGFLRQEQLSLAADKKNAVRYIKKCKKKPPKKNSR